MGCPSSESPVQQQQQQHLLKVVIHGQPTSLAFLHHKENWTAIFLTVFVDDFFDKLSRESNEMFSALANLFYAHVC